ncbi:Trifunctional nucleotide phosphoesterase protein YfkN precursor [Shimia sp. SK013]|nr:Trifunctional nucleotide phosphoesterase protein YfkN precursor [Shimia sp. SK013]
MPRSYEVGTAPKCLTVRLLATSDVHAQLLAYDYFRETRTDGPSLARLASLIRELRDEADASILVDNGDFLQGGQIAEVSLTDVSEIGNPVISAMNALGYDAVGLGNHEFDVDEPLLRKSLELAEFPILCSNLTSTDGEVRYQGLWQKRVIVPVHVLTDACDETVKIGVFSVLPPQVVDWAAVRLARGVRARDIVATAREQAAALRAEGADIVVALAHSGITTVSAEYMSENAAPEVAALDDVDVVVAGHIHERFPRESYPDSAAIDGKRGSLHGKPAVMPGAMAAFLGKIDLRLVKVEEKIEGGRTWCIDDYKCETVAGRACVEDPEIVEVLQPAQHVAIKRLSEVIGHLARPVSTHFSMVKDGCATRILAEAKLAALREELHGTAHEHLPLLASVAPTRCGGRAGPLNYVDIAPGPLLERSIGQMQPFANFISLLRLNGAELVDWLDMAASLYAQMVPNQPDQLLFERDTPAYKRETVYGVSYEVDLSGPARFSLAGEDLRPEKTRIRNLMWRGAPVQPTQEFLLATNDFRAGGGGNFPGVRPSKIVPLRPMHMRDALVKYLATDTDCSEQVIPSWTFARLKNVSAVFETGAAAMQYFDRQDLPLTPLGASEDGFLRFRLDLDNPRWPG